MKRIFIAVLLLAMEAAVAQNNPVADRKAVVKRGFARFTVLTPDLIRLEYDSTEHFNDAASFVVINRQLPVPAFTVHEKGGWLTITTDQLVLTYQVGSGQFNARNLGIVSRDGRVNWKPGDRQQQNLKGTYCTLDRMDGDSDLYFKRRLQLEDGLLARDGWTLLDDSKSLLFDPTGWVKVNEQPETDWYFMTYGHDYKTALLDFTRMAGKIPLPPRYAFGYWWSRYWSYSDNELRGLVDNFHHFNIPLDVLVIDMDWHKELSKDQWTGWTFNDAYFPDSKRFLNWVHQQNLKVTLNLHPAYGIAPGEEAVKTDTVITYKGSDKQFMGLLFNQVLKPLQQRGVDFWWLDWQQWPKDKAIPQLDNVWWLNYTFFSNAQKASPARALIYHRWGGLGNHRYQTGFSGDTYISWKSLAYQPEFTNTASNVLYGYWSHDIGGHMSLPGQEGIDPELYTRWVQYGVFSPIFRTHSSKNPTLNKELWNYRGDYFDALTNAIQWRYQLAPYIYTMAREGYDTGISLCRPLYYDYPELSEAYQNKSEYLFGDDILVAPIGQPMQNGRSAVNLWLPPGNNWYEWQTGTILKGGQKVTREFSITEYPVYIKAGAVLPMYPDTVKNLQQQPRKQIFALFPGEGRSTFSLYEDNGDDQYYDKRYAITKIAGQTSGGITTVTIYPSTGNYAGMQVHKDYELQLVGTLPPKSVWINGKPVRTVYDGSQLTTIVRIPGTNCRKKAVILVQNSTAAGIDLNNGLVEKMKRVRNAVKGLKYKNADLVISPEIGHMEELNRELEYRPVNAPQLIQKFNEDYHRLPELVKALKLSRDNENWFLTTMGIDK